MREFIRAVVVMFFCVLFSFISQSDALAFSGAGSGSELDPYEITSCSQLQEMGDDLSSSYELMNAIDCSDTPTWNGGNGFVPIGDSITPFTGTLNGNDFSVSDLYMFKKGSYIGLFGVLENAEISNLDLVNIDYECAEITYDEDVEYIGGLAGDTISSIITEVDVEGSLSVVPGDDSGADYYNYIGGLSGRVSGVSVITFSSTDIEIEEDVYGLFMDVGGFIGFAIGDSLIEDSTADVQISGDRFERVGGFVGTQFEDVMINNSSSAGDIHISTMVYSIFNVGGFVGALGADAAGYLGYPLGNTKIMNSYSSVNLNLDVESPAIVGGFAGFQEEGTTIEDSYSTGTLKIIGFSANQADRIGGFIGMSSGIISKSISTSSILISGYEIVFDVGGFLGSSDLSFFIDQSASFGTVSIINTDSATMIGGFIGSNYRSDEENIAVGMSYSRSNIINFATSISSTGGFLGSASDNGGGVMPVHAIINSYSTGKVATNGYPSYGFIDDNTSGYLMIMSSYWDIESSGTSSSNGGVGYTTAQLKDNSNLIGWDFDDTWEYNASLNDGYPIFQWQTLAPNLAESYPEIYLDPVDPNPTPDTTPSITGFALDASNIAEVSFQMYGTDSDWEECVAVDGTFDSAYEIFSCTVSNPLEEGEHTMYVKASNDLAIETPSGQEASITFEVDTSIKPIEIENSGIIIEDSGIGRGSSIVVGPSGNPIISHVDWTESDLKLVFCNDKDCNTFSEVTVDDGNPRYSPFTSLDIGNDGFARIAFYNNNSDNLRFARCNDASCSAPIVNDIPIGLAEDDNDIVLKVGSDGYSRIMVHGSDNILHYITCTDADCLTYNDVPVSGDIGSGIYSMDMVLNNSDIPLYIYENVSTYNLEYAYCTDSVCSSYNDVVINEGYGAGATLTIGSDGFPRIAYTGASDTLEFVKCSNLSCSSSNKQVLSEYTSDYSSRSSVVLLDEDLPFITYVGPLGLYGLACTDSSCSAGNSVPIQTTGDLDRYGLDVVISDDKRDIFISYYEDDNDDLGFAHLVQLTLLAPEISLDTVPEEISTSSYDITGSSTDTDETLYAVHFQVDGYEYDGWTSCTADDGTFDEADEDFTCSLTGLSNGEHTVYIRAMDSGGTATVYPNHATATFTVIPANPAPDLPTNLTQYKSDGSTLLTVGSDTDETTVILKMTVSDDDYPETLTAEVEVRSIGVSFTDTETHTGSGLSFTGTPLTAQLSITGLTDGFSYHWQARVCDEGSLCSDWVSYGLNAESASDFSVVLASQEEEQPPVLPPTTPTTPTPSTPPVNEEEETVEEEEVVEEEEPTEEENKDITPPVEEPSEDEEEKESIFVTISNRVKDVSKKVISSISNIDVPQDVSESIAVTGIAVVSTHALLTNVVAFGSSQTLSGLQFLSSFFLIGGLKRKKNQKYSLVYDSVSKEPINLATVRIMDETGKLVSTVVTDVYGVFDVKLSDGKYSFSVVSKNHSFPSQAMLGSSDDPYQNVYKGGLVEYSSSTGLNISIPMDREEKGVLGMVFSSGRSAFVSILNVILKLLFVVGFGMTLISLSKEPTTLTWISLGLYILISLLYLLFAYRDRQSFGVAKTVQGNPIEGLEIGVRELEFDTIYSKRVSDQNGKYRFILPGGKYRLEILNSNYELVETENDTFEIKDGSLYIVKENIVVRRKV